MTYASFLTYLFLMGQNIEFRAKSKYFLPQPKGALLLRFKRFGVKR